MQDARELARNHDDRNMLDRLAIRSPHARNADHVLTRSRRLAAASQSASGTATSPCFVIRPSKSMDVSDWCRLGVWPKCAPTVRDRAKRRGSSTPTLNQRAATGPTLGTVIKRRQTRHVGPPAGAFDAICRSPRGSPAAPSTWLRWSLRRSDRNARAPRGPGLRLFVDSGKAARPRKLLTASSRPDRSAIDPRYPARGVCLRLL
jgi:hypothetical protein